MLLTFFSPRFVSINWVQCSLGERSSLASLVCFGKQLLEITHTKHDMHFTMPRSVFLWLRMTWFLSPLRQNSDSGCSVWVPSWAHSVLYYQSLKSGCDEWEGNFNMSQASGMYLFQRLALWFLPSKNPNLRWAKSWKPWAVQIRKLKTHTEHTKPEPLTKLSCFYSGLELVFAFMEKVIKQFVTYL